MLSVSTSNRRWSYINCSLNIDEGLLWLTCCKHTHMRCYANVHTWQTGCFVNEANVMGGAVTAFLISRDGDQTPCFWPISVCVHAETTKCTHYNIQPPGPYYTAASSVPSVCSFFSLLLLSSSALAPFALINLFSIRGPLLLFCQQPHLSCASIIHPYGPSTPLPFSLVGVGVFISIFPPHPYLSHLCC